MKFHITLYAAAAAAVACSGCSNSPTAAADAAPKTVPTSFETAAEPLANGHVTAISEVDADGNPKAIGFKFKTAMLEGLPKDLNMDAPWFDINGNGKLDMDMMSDPPLIETHGAYTAWLTIPGNLKDVPFKALEFDWNPMGHDPQPWMVPHIDFHFYTVTKEDVMAIKLGPAGFLIGEEEYQRAIKPVDTAYIGKGFLSVGAAVGQMGDHLIDPTSPELAPQSTTPFTHTFIYGAYDGKVTFWEPMITAEYLLKKETLEKDIALPTKYAEAGWWPTKYCVRHNGEYTTVSLEGFVKREAN